MVKIRNIMKKDVITVSPEVTISDCAKIMTNNRIGSVVIMTGHEPAGIITDDDIVGVIAKGLDPKRIKVKDLKKDKKFITVSPEDDMLKVTKLMVKTGVKRIPVLEKGRLVGIVSDKEVLIVSPELIDIMSEKLKTRVSMVAAQDQEISGICERCEAYSDELRNVNGRWWCEDCRGG